MAVSVSVFGWLVRVRRNRYGHYVLTFPTYPPQRITLTPGKLASHHSVVAAMLGKGIAPKISPDAVLTKSWWLSTAVHDIVEACNRRSVA